VLTQSNEIKCKVCCRCKELKPISEFHKHKRYLYGVRPICKVCRKKYEKRYESKEGKARYFQENYDRMTETHKAYWIRLADKVYARLGNHCMRCGFDDRRALQIDHINGGGVEEHKKMNHNRFLNHLLEISEEELFSNYQVLCANCNWIKKSENKEVRKKLQ
jgi:hypothetical protein